MLLKLSDHISNCLEHAARAKERAELATDSRVRIDYLRLEKTWNILAQSYQLSGSLKHFLAGNARIGTRAQWQSVANVPHGLAVEVGVLQQNSLVVLGTACQRDPDGWVSVATKRRIEIDPTHWRSWDRAFGFAENLCIAIIDDDATVRTSTQALLQSLGCRVAGFASAEEFIASPLLPETACLISDLQMPGMSGLELQARLKSEGSRLPIIFITGIPNEVSRAAALAHGAFGFLSKPVDQTELITCLERALATVGIVRDPAFSLL